MEIWDREGNDIQLEVPEEVADELVARGLIKKCGCEPDCVVAYMDDEQRIVELVVEELMTPPPDFTLQLKRVLEEGA